jgi:hypothetical protein
VAARPIGGLCAKTLRFDGGMPLEELLLRHAVGENVERLKREQKASGVMMIPIERAGIYEHVEGLEDALRTPGVEEITITAKIGQTLEPLPEGSSYLGFIFSRGATPDAVEESLKRAHAKLRFQIAAKLPLPALIHFGCADSLRFLGDKVRRQRRSRAEKVIFHLLDQEFLRLLCRQLSRYSFMSIFMCSIHILPGFFETFSKIPLADRVSSSNGGSSRPVISFWNFTQKTLRAPGFSSGGPIGTPPPHAM